MMSRSSKFMFLLYLCIETCRHVCECEFITSCSHCLRVHSAFTTSYFLRGPFPLISNNLCGLFPLSPNYCVFCDVFVPSPQMLFVRSVCPSLNYFLRGSCPIFLGSLFPLPSNPFCVVRSPSSK